MAEDHAAVDEIDMTRNVAVLEQLPYSIEADLVLSSSMQQRRRVIRSISTLHACACMALQ